jgi:hypothetical protein
MRPRNRIKKEILMKEYDKSRDFMGTIGIAEIDITPPVGIYNRCWGAATSYTAQGVHMPFYATAAVIGDDSPLVVIGFDASWWMGCLPHDCIQEIAQKLQTEAARIHLCMSHTHAGVPIMHIAPEEPGAELHKTYVDELYSKLVAVAVEASENRKGAYLQTRYGVCDLARNRDLIHNESYVTGYNPDGEHDDTLVTSCITDNAGNVNGVFVNYACHPTTLAWENDQLSPDYIGSLRETVRRHLSVPMLFLQGCSGDLGPALGFTGDVTVAERHGRHLAHASLATIESMGTAGTKLHLDTVKKSGADLGVWKETVSASDKILRCSHATLTWPIRDGLLKSAEVHELLEKNPDNPEEERLKRKLRVREIVGEGDDLEFTSWFARIGRTLFVSFPGEAYSKMQKDLRARYPEYTIICVNVCAAWIGYIVPEDDYEKPNLYPAWQTPLAPGVFEALYALCTTEFDKLTGD